MLEMEHTVTFSALFLVFATSLTIASPHFNAEKVNSMIEIGQRCRQNTSPGLAVSVVRDDRTLLSRGYGVTTPHGNTRVSSETRFNVASLTKAVTAALLVKVMEESGRYNLSTPVRDILGSNFRFEDDLRTEHATVEDLLSHKMAVPAHSRLRFDSTLTRETLVRRIRYLKSYDTFRTTFIYSNIMYGLASHITEVIGKARWEDLVKRHFFYPLGMRRSTFTTEADLNETDTAKPYEVYHGNLEPISLDLPRLFGELVGSGAFISTADDMAKWMNFHLSEGLSPLGQRVMKKKSVRELHQPRTAMPQSSMPLFLQPDVPVTISFDIYAMGWWTGYYRGYPILGHSGASYGYRALIVLVPSLKVGVFIGMNGDDANYSFRGPLVSLILDHALGVTPWVDSNILCTFPSPWHNVSSVPPPSYNARLPLTHNISAYLGDFENPAYGRLEIRLADRRMHRRGSIYRRNHVTPVLMMLYGFAEWDLIPLEPKYFALNSEVSSAAEFPEYFFGLGKGVTTFIDISPFIFHPPSKGSDVIEELSAPAFEKRFPPIFRRVTANRNSSQSMTYRPTGQSSLFWFTIILAYMLQSR